MGKSQAQTRQHIAQTQAQAREQRKFMLDLEHQAIHDPAITLQEILNEQKYEHHECLLKLERHYASPEIAIGPPKMVPGSFIVGSRDEPAFPPREQVSGYVGAGSRKGAALEPEDEVMGSNKMPNTGRKRQNNIETWQIRW